MTQTVSMMKNEYLDHLDELKVVYYNLSEPERLAYFNSYKQAVERYYSLIHLCNELEGNMYGDRDYD